MASLFKTLIKVWAAMRRIGGPLAVVAFLRTAPQQIALFKRLMADPRVPAFPKALLVAAAAFAVSPLNLPGWVPVLGALDDLGIFLLAFNVFTRFIPKDVLSDHRLAVGLQPAI